MKRLDRTARGFRTSGLLLAVAIAFHSIDGTAAEPKSLFDGKSFAGWEGDTKATWRIEDGAIVGGSLTEKVPRNEFLCTEKSYANFELRLQYKLEGSEGFVNGGVQIRSQRVPNHYEMIGYQADIGAGYDGAIYDESRRNKMLAKPDAETLAKAVKPNDWNRYRIRCEGKRIQLWVNDVQTVDYAEEDAAIPQTGLIGLQIHGNGKAIIRFRNIEIEELPGA